MRLRVLSIAIAVGISLAPIAFAGPLDAKLPDLREPGTCREVLDGLYACYLLDGSVTFVNELRDRLAHSCIYVDLSTTPPIAFIEQC